MIVASGLPGQKKGQQADEYDKVFKWSDPHNGADYPCWRKSSSSIRDNSFLYRCLDNQGQRLLEMVTDKLGLSARSYSRILKVARTIADLAGEKKIRQPHLAEAIQYRRLDRKAHCPSIIGMQRSYFQTSLGRSKTRP